MWKAWWQLHRSALLALTGLYLLATVPFVSKLPFNWDAAQFNLALHTYDIGMHQPHPPGYPLFILLGKALGWLTGDNLALVIISALFGLVSVVMLYLFSYRLTTNRFSSALIAICWLLNPLFWLYREVALTYTVDAAASITLGYLAWQTITLRQRYYLLMSAGVLTVAGAVRPSLLLLLLPLFLFQATFHRRNWKFLLLVLGILTVGTLAWLIPVCWLSGGVGEYITYSRNLYGTAAESLAIWPQTKLVWNTLLSSLNVMVIPILLGLVLVIIQYVRWWRKVWPMAVYALCWLAPALIVYCFVHFGQVGYALIVVVPWYLLLVPVLQTINHLQPKVWAYLAMWAGIGLIVLHALVFLVLTPAYGHPNFFPRTRAELYFQHLARYTPNLFKWNRTIINDSDRYLSGVREIVNYYPADETVIVTGRDLLYPSPANGLPIRNDEVFREVSYLLPEYQVVEIAPQRDYYLESTQYQMEVAYSTTVTIPNTARYVLFMVDVIPSAMQPTLINTGETAHLEPAGIPGTDHQLLVGVIDQAWSLGAITLARPADQIIPNELRQHP